MRSAAWTSFLRQSPHQRPRAGARHTHLWCDRAAEEPYERRRNAAIESVRAVLSAPRQLGNSGIARAGLESSIRRCKIRSCLRNPKPLTQWLKRTSATLIEHLSARIFAKRQKSAFARCRICNDSPTRFGALAAPFETCNDTVRNTIVSIEP